MFAELFAKTAILVKKPFKMVNYATFITKVWRHKKEDKKERKTVLYKPFKRKNCVYSTFKIIQWIGLHICTCTQTQ